jgi:hypothetical protein
MAIPTLAYNSDVWTLTKKQKGEIAEVKFLRNVAG